MTMDDQQENHKVRTILLTCAVGHGVFLVGTGVVHDWIDFLQIMPLLFSHFLLLAGIPILGALMLFTKWNRYGTLLMMVSATILLIYFLMFRFRILPPLVPRTPALFPRVLYEVSYWGTLSLEVTIVWFSLKLYKVLIESLPKNTGE